MNSSESERKSCLLRDKEMRGSEEEEEEGYREMESGLDASFLWSHDKSEKDGEKRREGKRE